jgi:hypothetical protein
MMPFIVSITNYLRHQWLRSKFPQTQPGKAGITQSLRFTVVYPSKSSNVKLM